MVVVQVLVRVEFVVDRGARLQLAVGDEGVVAHLGYLQPVEMDRLTLVPVMHLHQVTLRVVYAQIVERLLKEVTAIFPGNDALVTDLDFVAHLFTTMGRLRVFSCTRSGTSFQLGREFERRAVAAVIGSLLWLRGVAATHLALLLNHKRFFYVLVGRQAGVIWCLDSPTR